LPEDYNFTNTFQKTGHKKIIHGIQQLYIIGKYIWCPGVLRKCNFLFILGIFDILPIHKILDILRKHLPPVMVNKLHKYVTTDCDKLRSHINWSSFKAQLDNINVDPCSTELVNFCEQLVLSPENVKTFHIANNLQSKKAIEPTHDNTTAMIYEFLTYIYQRNVLSTVIKYIILKSILCKFDQSELTISKKGIFSQMKSRLHEIVFECILTAFNGSNYDNFLLCNSLVIILTKLNEKIQIFKKGASLSTIIINIKHNLNRFTNITESLTKIKEKKDSADNFPMNLFIKDIRNMLAANMSLDKVGKLFNLPVSKLCFPYEKATSIKILKTLDQLHPYNDRFWQDSFTSKTVTLQDRIDAQMLFTSKGFSNLYEYSNFYLVQDCLLLHSIVMTLFNNYLNDSINIFLRRNYSQSNLSYQQFFVIEPSKQIDHVLAPKKISNPFFNYFIRQAVTGGLCTSFVHGKINSNTVINKHFAHFGKFNLDESNWPNFQNIQPQDFVKTPAGINTIDIRSLYPSATLKNIPVNTPLCFTRISQSNVQDLKPQNMSNIHIQSFCKHVRNNGDFTTDSFQLINKPPRFYNEYNALNIYLKNLPSNLTIIHFQSSFTALGQLYFGEYPVDGFLVYKKDQDNTLYINIIQYQSVFYHGHTSSCSIKNNDEQKQKCDNSVEIQSKITKLWHHFVQHFNTMNVVFKYVEVSDCHFQYHKVPSIKSLIFPYKKRYSYHSFLSDIYSKKLTGFIVVKNLEIRKNNQNPIFGFIIQKAQYELNKLSNYTQKLLKHFNPSQRVVSLHKCSAFMVISTQYFVWLHNLFGFESTPDIYHALLFQMEPYLRQHIESKLIQRKDLKTLIKLEKNSEIRQRLEIKAELIKLMLNSCYGFTLCNLNSSKFKCFRNLHCVPKHNKRKTKIKSCIELSPQVYLAEFKTELQEPFETMLGHVGCVILFNSKIILLKRLVFLFKYINPTQGMICYTDTDSAHFLLEYPEFIDNVDDHLKDEFKKNFDKHFETGNKISGIWVQEGFYKSAKYIGEKSYVLYNPTNSLSHMKGLNNFFQKTFTDLDIDHTNYTNISYNLFHKSNDFSVLKTYMNKNLFSNYVPTKRYFVSAAESLPLQL
jgi:hypothetical protein